MATVLSAVLSSITAGCVATAHVVDQGKGLTERSMAVIIASLEVIWLPCCHSLLHCCHCHCCFH